MPKNTRKPAGKRAAVSSRRTASSNKSKTPSNYFRTLTNRSLISWASAVLIVLAVALIGLRLLTPTHAAPAAYPNLNAKLVPTIPGALLGSTSNDAGSSNLFGRKLDIIHFYYRWSNNFPLSGDQVYTATQAGQIPLVSWNPVGISWTAITAGSYNAYIDQIAHNFVAYNNTFHKPVFLVFNHEADARIRKGQGTAAQFQAAWRYIHDRFAADGATNVVWTMVLTAAPFSSPNNPTYGVNVMYPGDAYVDWVADDPYNWWDCPAHQSSYKTMYQLFSPLSVWDQTSNPAIGHTNTNLPLMIAETGSEENLGSGGAGLSKAGWFTAGITQIQSLPRIKAVVYFDHAQSTSVICNWIINSSAASQAAAHQLAINPYFNVMTQAPAPVDQPPTVSITSPASGSTVGGVVQLAATATDTDSTPVNSSGVVFRYRDSSGTSHAIGSAMTPASGTTYSLNWDTTGLSSGTYVVVAKATDTAGNVSAPSAIQVTVSNSSSTSHTCSGAPSAPANLTAAATASGTAVDLSWSASTPASNCAVAGYRIYRDSNLLTSVSGSTSYADTSAAVGSHTYYVTAYDASGHVSAASATATAVVPRIATVTLTAPLPGALLHKIVTLTAAPRGDVSSLVFLADGHPVTSPQSAVGASSVSVNWDTTNVGNGTHQLSVVAYSPTGTVVAQNAESVHVSNGQVCVAVWHWGGKTTYLCVL